MVRWSWVNFQCRGVLLVWIRVGQGPTALAVGAGGGCLDIFTLIYPFSSLSPSVWETTRYRLKYCLKGSLSPKTTNQLYPSTAFQVAPTCTNKKCSCADSNATQINAPFGSNCVSYCIGKNNVTPTFVVNKILSLFFYNTIYASLFKKHYILYFKPFESDLQVVYKLMHLVFPLACKIC